MQGTVLTTVYHINNTILPDLVNEIERVIEDIDPATGLPDAAALAHLVGAYQNWQVGVGAGANFSAVQLPACLASGAC